MSSRPQASGEAKVKWIPGSDDAPLLRVVPSDGRASTAAAVMCVVRGHNGYREVREDGSVLVACVKCGYAIEERTPHNGGKIHE